MISKVLGRARQHIGHIGLPPLYGGCFGVKSHPNDSSTHINASWYPSPSSPATQLATLHCWPYPYFLRQDRRTINPSQTGHVTGSRSDCHWVGTFQNSVRKSKHLSGFGGSWRRKLATTISTILTARLQQEKSLKRREGTLSGKCKLESVTSNIVQTAFRWYSGRSVEWFLHCFACDQFLKKGSLYDCFSFYRSILSSCDGWKSCSDFCSRNRCSCSSCLFLRVRSALITLYAPKAVIAAFACIVSL